MGEEPEVQTPCTELPDPPTTEKVTAPVGGGPLKTMVAYRVALAVPYGTSTLLT